jgi:hypothetical protein
MALLATCENGRDRNGSNDPTELRGIAAPAELDRRRETPKADLGLQRVEAKLARRAELSECNLVWRSWIPTGFDLVVGTGREKYPRSCGASGHQTLLRAALRALRGIATHPQPRRFVPEGCSRSGRKSCRTSGCLSTCDCANASDTVDRRSWCRII